MEKRSPKIMVEDIGFQTGDSPPNPIAMGRSPPIVVMEVRIIGLNLTVLASMTASLREFPLFLSLLIKLIRTIESFTQIPVRATPAKRTMIEMGVPDISKNKIHPTKEKGMVNIIKNG